MWKILSFSFELNNSNSKRFRIIEYKEDTITERIVTLGDNIETKLFRAWGCFHYVDQEILLISDSFSSILPINTSYHYICVYIYLYIVKFLFYNSDVAQERSHNALIASVENFNSSSLKKTDTREKIVLPNAKGNKANEMKWFYPNELIVLQTVAS